MEPLIYRSVYFQKQVDHADASRSLDKVGESLRQSIIKCDKNPSNFLLSAPTLKPPPTAMRTTPRPTTPKMTKLPKEAPEAQVRSKST
jgi:hypothetical protein